MEPSSNQNPSANDNNSRAQKSLHNEDISENSEPKNSAETAENNGFVQKADVTESNIISTTEPHFNASNEEDSVINLEKEKATRSVAEDQLPTDKIQNRQVIMVYEAKNRPRQPFFNSNTQSSGTNPRLPAPPNYYPTSTPHPQPNRAIENTRPPAPQSNEQRFQAPQFYQMGQLALFSDIFINAATWAQYPTNIPPGVPPGLAHLVDAEVIFIVQKIDFLSLAIGYSDLNMFLIENKNGEYLYYAYETTSVWAQLCCCRGSRNFQIHIMDMYQNEVIYLNKPFGCTYFCCCYPVIEVYAPPMIPVGAVMKVFHPYHEEFVIVDPDENVIFRISGSNMLKHCCSCNLLEFTFTIYALDPQKTVVGYIKRDSGGFFRPVFTDADLYGISFPKNMDVRIKATFLGALFLISLKRTGWVLRNVEDPETVSGHMYRMSIMTFLIPESSGVDKTKCMKLSLVHDLAECIVGDLTPYCGVDTSEKHRQEEVAMKELTQMIGDSGIEIYKLYKEYEAQVTEESKFVKDLDRLDMILQAFEYEKLGEKPGKLEEFFASTINKFHFPWTIDIVKEIYKQRNLHINKDKSLGKGL